MNHVIIYALSLDAAKQTAAFLSGYVEAMGYTSVITQEHNLQNLAADFVFHVRVDRIEATYGLGAVIDAAVKPKNDNTMNDPEKPQAIPASCDVPPETPADAVPAADASDGGASADCGAGAAGGGE